MATQTSSSAMDNRPEFDFEAVFEVSDYMYFYGDTLTEEASDVQVAALVELVDLHSPKRILDLACGFGRHANRLAALGHTVTGLDFSAGFLEMARAGAAERRVQVEYIQGDMRQIDFEEEFERVMLLFTAFGYFEDDQNLRVLENIARALKPGCLFAMDINNRDAFLKIQRPDIVTEKDGNLMIDRTSLDLETGRLHNRRIVIRDGKRRDKPFFVRLYNANEIRDLLPRAGLHLRGIYGGWGLEPLSAESRRMVIVAEKPDNPLGGDG